MIHLEVWNIDWTSMEIIHSKLKVKFSQKKGDFFSNIVQIIR